MKKTTWRYSLLLACLATLMLVATGSAHEPISLPPIDTESVESEGENDWLTAIVVVRAASGASYMEDRDYIATMPELETIEEMQAHTAKYEPDPQEMQQVSTYLEEQGFNIVVRGNLFIVISGQQRDFEKITSDSILDSAKEEFAHSKTCIVSQRHLTNPTTDVADSIEGMIVYRPGLDFKQGTENTELMNRISSEPKFCDEYVGHKCPTESKTIGELADWLFVDHVHSQGIFGTGVKIGFIDYGVLTGHRFFHGANLNLRSYHFENSEIVPMTKDLINKEAPGHGTMVASYLSTFAPDAQLYSFLTPEDGYTDAPWLANYLIYMNQGNPSDRQLVDIISLSIAWDEGDEESEPYRPEIRQQLISFMAEGGVVLIASGNAEGDGSGHNALAAIPEVIAVGGADFTDNRLEYSAAGGYNDPCNSAKGSASFDSENYAGRHVPDIVGVFGPDLCYPEPTYTITKKIPFTTICWPVSKIDHNAYHRYTSMTSGATPQIAGIVALLKERHPNLNQIQVRSILQETARDIWQGQSGDGDEAAPGYDAATGYGIPIATLVLNHKRILNPGWNLIGLVKNHESNYSALDMLNEINTEAGYSCDTVTHWDTGQSRYESVILEQDGEIYGFDFDLDLGIAYWVRCNERTVWTESGDWVTAAQPLHVQQGWNFISIPYSEAPCTAGDVMSSFGTSNCTRVNEYTGEVQSILEIEGAGEDLFSARSGYFPLSTGKGYMVFCDEAADWVPNDCGSTNSTLDTSEAFHPANYYAPNSSRSQDLVQLTAKAQTLTAHTRNTAACTPQDVRISNVGAQMFSVSWTTQEPCMGSIVVNTGNVPVFQAHDDRGLRFSGTTHHVTLRGLESDTIYSLGLLSGDVWDTNNGSFYQVRTGKILRLPSYNYDILGQLTGPSAAPVDDAVVYVRLQNDDLNPTTQSTWLSFPWDEHMQGYAVVLDNARNQDRMAYFDYTSATYVKVEAEGGSSGQDGFTQAIDLATFPTVNATDLVLNKATVNRPMLTSPISRTLYLRPTFTFVATDDTGKDLTYRLELSTDGFANVAEAYDQQQSGPGWSADSYSSGQQAIFTLPHDLENMRGYQWRVFAHNGETWSSASDIGSFAISRYFQIYLPVVLRAFAGSPSPGPTPTTNPTATPTLTPTPVPVIPDPIYPTSTPIPLVDTITCRIRFQGRTTTDPDVGGHNVYVRAVIRKTDSTILYQGDDLSVVSGTTPEQDYGTLTLSELSNMNIVVGTPYELLITGKMHLTRKWTVTFETENPLLDLTGADDLLWSGDLNADNRINDTDYEIFVDEFPYPSTPEMFYKMNFNGDDKISMADYAIWKDSYIYGPGVGDE